MVTLVHQTARLRSASSGCSTARDISPSIWARVPQAVASTRYVSLKLSAEGLSPATSARAEYLSGTSISSRNQRRDACFTPHARRSKPSEIDGKRWHDPELAR